MDMASQDLTSPIPKCIPQMSAAEGLAITTERQLLFVSEYYFKPEAVNQILENFKFQIEAQQVFAKLSYIHQKYAFIIICTPGKMKTVCEIFHTILTTIINEECRKSAGIVEYQDKKKESENDDEDEDDENDDDDDDDDEIDEDLLKSEKIERLDVWRMQNETQINFERSILGLYDYPVQIQRCSFKNTYVLNEDSMMMDDIFKDSLLDELRHVTGCIFVKEIENNIIYVGSETEEGLENATSKIKNIKEYFQPTPLTYHTLYTEADTNLNFAFLRLSTAKNRLFKTTLLNFPRKTFNFYQEMFEKAVIIRYATYDKTHNLFKISWKLKIAPIVIEKDENFESKAWEIPKYPARGPRDADPRRWIANHKIPTLASVVSNTTPRKKNRGTAKQSTINWIKNFAESSPIRGLPKKKSASTSVEPIGPSYHESSSFQENKKPAKPSWDNFQEPLPTALKENLETTKRSPRLLNENINQQETQKFQSVTTKSLERHPLDSLSISKISHKFETPPQQTSHLLDADPAVDCYEKLSKPLSPVRLDIPLDPNTSSPLSNQKINTNLDFEYKFLQYNNQAGSLVKNIMDDDDLNNLSFDVLTPNVRQYVTTNPANFKSQKVDIEITDDANKNTGIEMTPENVQASSSQQNEKSNENLFILIDSSRNQMESLSQSRIEMGYREVHKPKDRIISDSETMEDKTNSKQLIDDLTSISSSKTIKEPAKLASTLPKMEYESMQEFHQQIRSSFGLMMEKFRAYRGTLTVEVNFGRILLNIVHDNYLAKKSSTERTFTGKQTLEILMNASVHTSDSKFTKILTMMPIEIEHIIKMKDIRGLNYWIPRRFETSIIYELSFSDKRNSKSRFILEINAENFMTRVKTSSELGNIYVHGTKRSWDFRLSATGTGGEIELLKLHHELVDMVSTSLFIPENCTSLDLYFEIKKPFDDRYLLEEATARHVGRHMSEDKKSILHICEVQLLEITTKEISDRNSIIFRASYNKDKQEPQELSMWFEVSIRSVELEALSIQNKTLKLGELTDWTIEFLNTRSIAENLIIPACWVLENLDGIGTYNNNGYEMRESNITATPKVAANAYYW